MIINWLGPIGPTGYGRFTRFIVPAIDNLGHTVCVTPAYPAEFPHADEEIKKYIHNMDENILNADAAVRLTLSNPSDTIMIHGKKRVFFNMLEVDRIPDVWVKSLNTVDEVWSPSNWGKKVYKKSGVTVPIKVVPGGVDLSNFNPWREPLIEKPTDKYRFLFVGKWEHRKGVDILLRAFSEEFGEKENVELVLACDSIKWFAPQFNIYKALLNLKLPSDRPTIQIMEGMIKEYHHMGRLYNSCDAFVNPTRGEGWNLPLIEALACGLPSIATNWSAHTEFANEKNAYMLNDYKLVSAANTGQQISPFYLQQGKWAEPSIKEVKEKMRYIFDNQNEAKKKGKFAAKDMENWTWKESGRKAVKNLEELIK